MGYDRDLKVWACNMEAVLLFNELGSQWRGGGMGGRIGLDYSVIYQRLDRLYPEREDWERSYALLRVMEGSALEASTTRDNDGDD